MLAAGVRYLEIGQKPAVFACLINSITPPYQQHNTSADCARELFKPSKDSARLLVCNEKNVIWFCFFVIAIISDVGFWPFWLTLPGLGPNR